MQTRSIVGTPITARLLAAASVAFALSACHAPGGVKAPPSAPLELIGSGAMVVPEACDASGSFVVDFTVFEDGRTGDIRPAEAPLCLQQALTAWVETFRYTAPPVETRSSVEWLLVQRSRTGS